MKGLPGGAARAWATTLIFAALVLVPLAMPVGWDSFPISSYPMFARGDLGTVVPVSHALLLTEGEGRRPAPPSLIGTPEVMVAKNIVELAIAQGRAAELCAKIAANAGGEARQVEIVTSTFDTRRYFEVSREPLAREVHARCEVPR
jgi:hypothetical protein